MLLRHDELPPTACKQASTLKSSLQCFRCEEFDRHIYCFGLSVRIGWCFAVQKFPTNVDGDDALLIRTLGDIRSKLLFFHQIQRNLVTVEPNKDRARHRVSPRLLDCLLGSSRHRIVKRVNGCDLWICGQYRLGSLETAFQCLTTRDVRYDLDIGVLLNG